MLMIEVCAWTHDNWDPCHHMQIWHHLGIMLTSCSGLIFVPPVIWGVVTSGDNLILSGYPLLWSADPSYCDLLIGITVSINLWTTAESLIAAPINRWTINMVVFDGMWWKKVQWKFWYFIPNIFYIILSIAWHQVWPPEISNYGAICIESMGYFHNATSPACIFTGNTLDGHACLEAMCFYWLWDGPLFISVATDKTVSWDWGDCFIICTILAVATATAGIHIYFAFYWDILMLSEAGNLQKLSIFWPLKNIWQTFWFPAWSRELLCTNQTRCWLFHGLKATTRIFFFQSLFSTSLPLKQMQWCGNLPTGLQSMTV